MGEGSVRSSRRRLLLSRRPCQGFLIQNLSTSFAKKSSSTMRAVQKNVTATVALTACFAFAAPTQDVTFAAEIPSNGQYGGLPRNSSFDDIVITDPTLSFQQMQPGYNGLAWENVRSLLYFCQHILTNPIDDGSTHWRWLAPRRAIDRRAGALGLPSSCLLPTTPGSSVQPSDSATTGRYCSHQHKLSG